MNRHCHSCGTEWTIDGQPGRGDVCPGCNEDLRACLNCVFHDRGVAYQCRERRAEFGFLHVGKPELGLHHGACEDCVTQLQLTAEKGKHPSCPICRNACTPLKVHCSM